MSSVRYHPITAWPPNWVASCRRTSFAAFWLLHAPHAQAMNASTLFFASEFGIHNICICLFLVYCATPDGRLTTKLESSFSDFLALHHSLVDGIGIDARRRLPILGPNPFCRKTFPDMEMVSLNICIVGHESYIFHDFSLLHYFACRTTSVKKSHWSV